MTDSKKRPHPAAPYAFLFAAAAGWALLRYCGMLIWAPGLIGIALALIFAKTRVHPRWFAGAIAATGGYTIWLLIACMISGVWKGIPDAVVLLGGIIWLWVRPGRGAIMLLGLFQFATLAFNGVRLFSVAVGDIMHRSFVADCILRLIAIGYLACGYLQMRRERIEVTGENSSPQT